MTEKRPRGRPASERGKVTEVYLNAGLAKQVETAAKAEGVTVPEWIRRAVTEKLTDSRP